MIDPHEFGLIEINGKVSIENDAMLVRSVDRLVRLAVFGDQITAAQAQYFIHNSALQLGIFPASIQEIYQARGRNQIPATFTVPAINLRSLPFDSARAAFRAAKKIDSGLTVFEIARVELLWADMTLEEYAACILGAAIAEQYTGPIFLQGDHFQVSSSQPLQRETAIIKNLIRRAILSGFYNIDIDSSTLVDLSKPTVAEQQFLNAMVTSDLAAFIRGLQPAGIQVSIGGEIGEVGGHVTTLEELHAYLTQFNQLYAAAAPGQAGLSKVSIHTGTTHGGILGTDGKIQDASIDFDAIQRISAAGQTHYGLGGVVQHGASTLKIEALSMLVDFGTLEVHLATAFMSTFFELLPPALKKQIEDWTCDHFADQRTVSMSDAQFFHKFGMHALAPFKKETWDLSDAEKQPILDRWGTQFEQIFRNLGCAGSRRLVEEYTPPRMIPFDMPEYADETPDESGVDLAG